MYLFAVHPIQFNVFVIFLHSQSVPTMSPQHNMLNPTTALYLYWGYLFALCVYPILSFEGEMHFSLYFSLDAILKGGKQNTKYSICFIFSTLPKYFNIISNTKYGSKLQGWPCIKCFFLKILYLLIAVAHFILLYQRVTMKWQAQFRICRTTGLVYKNSMILGECFIRIP